MITRSWSRLFVQGQVLKPRLCIYCDVYSSSKRHLTLFWPQSTLRALTMPLRTHYLELLLSDGAGSQQGSHTHSSTNGGGATGPSRRIDLTSLDAAVQGYFHKGLAPSTHRTYDAAMRRFSKFCVLYGIYDPFEKLMCYFATSLANDGLPTQTIKCYLSAVRSMQISLGLPPPSEHSSLPVLKRVLDGIRRCKVLGGKPPRIRLPITTTLD